MSTVAEVQGQMLAVDAYISSQLVHLPVQARDQSAAGLVKNLKVSVASLPSVDMPSATQLNNSIKDMQMLSDVHKGELTQAVAMKHLSFAAPSETAGNTKMQSIDNVCGIFTRSDVDVFIDPNKSPAQKVQRLVARTRLLGLKNPTEKPTMKNLGAYMCCHLYTNRWPSKLETLSVVDTIKDEIKTLGPSIPSSVPHVLKYPEDMSLLPVVIFEAAYSDELPIYEVPSKYLEMTSHVKLRKDKEPRDAKNIVQQLLSQAVQHGQGMQMQGYSQGQPPSMSPTPPWLQIYQQPMPCRGAPGMHIPMTPNAMLQHALGWTPPPSSSDGGSHENSPIAAYSAREHARGYPTLPAPPTEATPGWANIFDAKTALAQKAGVRDAPSAAAPDAAVVRMRLHCKTPVAAATSPTPMPKTIAELEKIAIGSKIDGRGASASSKPVKKATKAETVAKPKAKAKPRPGATPPGGGPSRGRPSTRIKKLGCSKCRYLPHGCSQCRAPGFHGH